MRTKWEKKMLNEEKSGSEIQKMFLYEEESELRILMACLSLLCVVYLELQKVVLVISVNLFTGKELLNAAKCHSVSPLQDLDKRHEF